MKRSVMIAALATVAVFVSASAEAQWVFIARKSLGKIKQMESEHTYTAAVILEARAKEVFKKALATVEANRELNLVRKDDASMTLAFRQGKAEATMRVEELSEKVSEILVSANASKRKGSMGPLVVGRILDVCRELKVECRQE